MFDPSDRAAIITGAAGNLGQAAVVAFTEAGATVTLADRKPDRLGALFPEMVDSPDHLLVTSVDGVVAEAVEQMAAGTTEQFGGIDILVNTVGGYQAGTPVHETALEVWDQMFDLILRPTVISCRALVPYMMEQEGGRIINVAARAALKGASDIAAYSAAKSAVIRLS